MQIYVNVYFCLEVKDSMSLKCLLSSLETPVSILEVRMKRRPFMILISNENDITIYVE